MRTVSRNDRGTARFETFKDLRLGIGNAAFILEKLDMRGCDGCDDRSVRLDLPDADSTADADRRLPQALVLTAIVISFAMTALFLVVLLASRGLTGTDHVDGRERDE